MIHSRGPIGVYLASRLPRRPREDKGSNTVADAERHERWRAQENDEDDRERPDVRDTL